MKIIVEPWHRNDLIRQGPSERAFKNRYIVNKSNEITKKPLCSPVMRMTLLGKGQLMWLEANFHAITICYIWLHFSPVKPTNQA